MLAQLLASLVPVVLFLQTGHWLVVLLG